MNLLDSKSILNLSNSNLNLLNSKSKLKKLDSNSKLKSTDSEIITKAKSQSKKNNNSKKSFNESEVIESIEATIKMASTSNNSDPTVNGHGTGQKSSHEPYIDPILFIIDAKNPNTVSKATLESHIKASIKGKVARFTVEETGKKDKDNIFRAS